MLETNSVKLTCKFTRCALLFTEASHGLSPMTTEQFQISCSSARKISKNAHKLVYNQEVG